MTESILPASGVADALGADPPPPEILRHLAYAEASFMLLEGLLQLFVVRGVLTSDEIVSTVESVIATKQQMILEGEHAHISLVASGVLSNLANSVAAMEISRRGAG